MLSVLGSKADVDPLAVLSPVGRTLEIGAPFDEQLHYGPEYYGGGEGIRYRLPNGSSSIYQSTAHTWEGFVKVAGWLRDLGMPGPRLLDLGCGAGGFVKHALGLGSTRSGSISPRRRWPRGARTSNSVGACSSGTSQARAARWRSPT
jgi:hypothetical protein